MPITRAQAEAELVRRGRDDLMADLGLATTADGANPDLGPVLDAALRRCGVTPAAALAPADADLALLAEVSLPKLLDLAWLQLLMEMQVRAAREVDQGVGVQSRLAFGQVARALELAIARLEARVKSQYGVGLGVLQGGVVRPPVAARCRGGEW